MLFGGEEVDSGMQYILGHIMKRGGLVVSSPRKLAGWIHVTSSTIFGGMIASLIEVTWYMKDFNCAVHKS